VPPLPGIDKSEVMECNTTIKTYLRCARAVFANEREYLEGLTLPKLEQFLKWSPELAAPEGHRELPADVRARIFEDLPRLRREDPAVWAFAELLLWTGARPVQVLRMGPEALQAEGVLVPEAKRGTSPLVMVAPEVLEELRALAVPGSVLGGERGEVVYRRLNAWLRACGVEGTQAAYSLRHFRLQEMREARGIEMAQALGGHRSSDMVERKYTRGAKVIPLVTPGEAKAAG
jgi:integrase